MQKVQNKGGKKYHFIVYIFSLKLNLILKHSLTGKKKLPAPVTCNNPTHLLTFRTNLYVKKKKKLHFFVLIEKMVFLLLQAHPEAILVAVMHVMEKTIAFLDPRKITSVKIAVIAKQ